MMKKSLYKNNKGISFVTVLVVITLLFIITSVIMDISVMAFKMKSVDLKSKENFYSGELVLNDINAGIQGMVSETFNEAYKNEMSSYISYMSTFKTEEQREKEFVNIYLELIKEKICNPSEPEKYDLELLKSYISPDLLNPDISKAEIAIESTSGCRIETGVYSGGGSELEGTLVILKGVHIEYKNGEMLSIIDTDICIGVPKVSFEYGITDRKISVSELVFYQNWKKG